jgi:outer membrane receptor for ferrienterochelin and colicin
MPLLQDKISPASDGFSEWQMYVEDDWVVNEFINIQAGLHGSVLQFGNGSQPYVSVQPRFAFMASNDPLVFKLGVSNMMQYVHLLSNSGLGLPTDIWIGAGEELSPQTSWIYNASLTYKILKGSVVGLDMYYKNFRDLTHFNEGEPVEINETGSWVTKIPVGKGEAYGAEIYFEKSVGKTQILASYTFSVSNRLFNDLNVGRTFPFSFNRLHNFKCNVYRKLSDFAEFSLNWTYASGNFYSRPEDVIVDVDGKIVLVYPEKNNARFAPYHRLDIGFGFFNKFSWGKTRLFLGLYNVYNRRNYFYTDIVRNRRNPSVFEINNYSLLPLTPNISYTVTF